MTKSSTKSQFHKRRINLQFQQHDALVQIFEMHMYGQCGILVNFQKWCLGKNTPSQRVGGVSKGMRPEGFLGLLGHPERFLQQKEHCSNDQYKVHEKDYTGSDAARVNKVRASTYGPGRQCTVGYGSRE